jgi:maltose/moltooligosaccharide transporter
MPLTVELSFYIGAVLFLGTVIWTVVTTPEYPPEDINAFKEQQIQRGGILNTFREIGTAVQEMPRTCDSLPGYSVLPGSVYTAFSLFSPSRSS